MSRPDLLRPWLLAVDPGEMTGLFALRLSGDDGPQVAQHEMPWLEALAWVHTFIKVDWVDRLVTERWVITSQAATRTRQAGAIKANGALEYLCSTNLGTQFHELNRSDRGRVSSAHLRQLGFWHRGGAGHANDAARHGVIALLRWYSTTAVAQRCASVLAGEMSDGGNEDADSTTAHGPDHHGAAHRG